MKKTYSTPVIDVKKFDVEDIITTSGAALTPTTGTVNVDATNAAVEIVAKW